jgi:transcriptional regulator with XRE-family HTH domain
MGKTTRDETIEDLRATIAANLRRLRGADERPPRLAQEALALTAGLDRTLVSKLERGVSSPSLETLLKLAQVLDVSVDELLRKG